MTSSMPVSETKRKLIRDIIESQNKAVGGVEKIDKRRLVIAGNVKSLPIYQFELTQIKFNKANGRIKSEVLEKESSLGRELDETEEDQKIVKDILLSLRREENNKTKVDLIKNGQMEPGIITCDGIVINGNRRKAILEEIFYEEDASEKYKYFDALVLPSSIKKSELWLIEAGIQLSATQQLDYSPVNHLLKLKEGLDSGLSKSEMAARIYGVSEEKILQDIARLKLIDEYLDVFINKPDRYYLIDNINEHFINLQTILDWANNPRGNIKFDWSPDKSDINELKLVCFFYIRQKFQHLRIRNIRIQFSKKSAWQQIRKSLEIFDITEDTEEDHYDEKLDELTSDLDFDEEEDSEFIKDIIEAQDKRQEAEWRGKHGKKLHMHFEDAQEQVEIDKDKGKPLALAKRALNNINGISIESNRLADDELDEVFSKLIKSINILRDKARKVRSKKEQPTKSITKKKSKKKRKRV